MSGWVGRVGVSALLMMLGSGGPALADEFDSTPTLLLGMNESVLVCEGQALILYEPPISSAPQNIKSINYLNLTKCTAPVGERVNQGDSRVEFLLPGKSCDNSIAEPVEQTLSVTWTTDTGRMETSTLKLSRVMTSVNDTAVVVTSQGKVTEGKYKGHRVVQQTVYADFQTGCLTGGTTDGQVGQTTLNLLPPLL